MRSRSNTAHGYAERFNPVEEEPEPQPEPDRITIPKLPSRSRSPAPESSPGGHGLRPTISRTSTYDSAANAQRDVSPARRLTRVPTDSSVITASRSSLRPVRQANAFADDYEDDNTAPSPDRSSQGSGNVISRVASWSQADAGANGKKAPPPPPPSRAKKPPPPPPTKRSALSASEVTRY